MIAEIKRAVKLKCTLGQLGSSELLKKMGHTHTWLEIQYTGRKVILHLYSPEPAVVKFSHSLTQRY